MKLLLLMALFSFQASATTFNYKAQQDIREGMVLVKQYQHLLGYSDADLLLIGGQVLSETGSTYRLTESLNYSCKKLLTFSYYRKHRKEANVDGRCNNHPANQRRIASKVYKRKTLGNHTGLDGWKYRGRGAGQLTGRYNYMLVQRWLDRNIPYLGLVLDIVNYPERVSNPKYALLTFLIYLRVSGYEFGLKSASKRASYNLSRKVNRYSPTKHQRWKNIAKADLLAI